MEKKKKRASSWGKMLLLAGFVAGILYLSMKDTYEEVLSSLLTLTWYDILLLIIASAFMYLLSGIILYLLARKSNPEYRCIDGIQTSFITMFASNVLFSASSKLIQYYLFYTHKLKADAATCVIAVEFLSYQILMLILTVSMMLFYHPMFLALLPNEIWLAWVGTLISFLPMIALSLLWYRPAQRITLRVLNWLIDVLPFSLDKGLWNEKLDEFMKTLNQIKDSYLKDHRLLIQVLLLNLLRHIVKHGVPILIAFVLGISLDPMMIWYLFLFSMFLDLWLTAIPIAGKHGFAEAGFISIYSVLVGDISAGAMMLLWRFVTFYSNTILGGIALALSPDISMEKIRELKEKK